MKYWFGIEAPLSDIWPAGQADLIICLKPWLRPFESATTDQISHQPIMIITHDALEMADLRADERMTRQDAVIEMVSQPVGPHKLARTLAACLDRQDHLTTNPTDPQDRSRSKSSSQPQLPIRRSSPTPSTSPSEVSRRMSNEELRDPFVLIVDDNKVNLRVRQISAAFIM